MKKFLLSLALVAMTLAFTACGDDEPSINDDPIKETVIGTNLINSTITISSNSVNYIETADYTFNIERGKKEATVSILASGVKFDSHMPIEVSFRMEDIKTSTFSENYVKFSATNVKFFDPSTGEENSRYALTNVKGYVDSKNKVYSLEYTVNGTWRVLVCNTTIRSRVTDNDYEYQLKPVLSPEDTKEQELFYSYEIDIKNMKAEVFIHHVQFTVDGQTSPPLKKISIPNLDVTATPTGLELTGNNIVPIYYTGANLDQGTPYPALIVTNFKSNVDITSGSKHHIFFNCHDGEHDNTSSLYLWDWKVATS